MTTQFRTATNRAPSAAGTAPDVADVAGGAPRAVPGAGPVNVTVNVTVDDIGGGIIWITLCPGATITAEDGIRVRERYRAMTGGAGAGVLLQVTGVESVSRDAFRFFTDAVTITAFAILGSTSVDRVIAHGRRGLPLPKCPSQYFTNQHEALSWLRELNPTPGTVIP